MDSSSHSSTYGCHRPTVATMASFPPITCPLASPRTIDGATVAGRPTHGGLTGRSEAASPGRRLTARTAEPRDDQPTVVWLPQSTKHRHHGRPRRSTPPTPALFFFSGQDVNLSLSISLDGLAAVAVTGTLRVGRGQGFSIGLCSCVVRLLCISNEARVLSRGNQPHPGARP